MANPRTVPDWLQLSINLQAVCNGISTDEYIQRLQYNLDFMYSTDDYDLIPFDDESRKHVQDVHRRFITKPDGFDYFIWMLRKQTEL